MSSSSAGTSLLLGLLEDLKSLLLLQLWLRVWVQDRTTFSVGATLGLIVLYAARYYLASPGLVVIRSQGICTRLEQGNGPNTQSSKRNTVSSLPISSFIPYLSLVLSRWIGNAQGCQ